MDKKNEEDFIRKSEDFNASEKTQTTESIILDLRGKITKMSAKYKNKISKLVTSQNFLIKENNEFKAKILDFEEKIEEKDGKIRRLIHNCTKSSIPCETLHVHMCVQNIFSWNLNKHISAASLALFLGIPFH